MMVMMMVVVLCCKVVLRITNNRWILGFGDVDEVCLLWDEREGEGGRDVLLREDRTIISTNQKFINYDSQWVRGKIFNRIQYT